MAVMHRTTIMLPLEVHERATRYARAHNMSLGELIRDSLANELADTAANERDPLFADEAVYAGPAPRDLSVAHDRYLYDK